MKKLLTVCMCLLLVMAMATTAFATNSTAFSAEASAETLYRGDTFTLTVSVNCDEPATSYGLMLNFDETVFELVDGSCTVTGTLVSSFNNGFAFMFQNPTAYSGTVGTVTLKVKEDAAFGTATIAGDASVKNGTEVVDATGCSVSLTIACKHTYGAWTEIEDGHEQTCSVCGYVQTADHTWDEGVIVENATCTAEGVAQYTCTACAATKDEAVAVLAHTYGTWENVDETSHKHACTVCLFEEIGEHDFAETLTVGEETHWYACECGAKGEEAAHVFDETVWNKDAKQHWHSCACGATSSEAEHVWVEEITGEGDHRYVCECGAEGEEADHDFDETVWNKDAEQHWHSCACGATAGEAEHVWDEGKITVDATQAQEGVKTFTCKDCGQTKDEKIAKLPDPQVNPENKPENKPENESENNPQTGDVMMIVPAAVIVLVAACVVVFMASKKKIGQ